jgi:hypothetical protein
MSMAEPAATRDSASPRAAPGGRGESPGGDLLAPLLPAGEPVEGLLRKAQFFVPGGSPSPDFLAGFPRSHLAPGQRSA